MSDDNSGLLQAQWNRFNRSYTPPASEDAQRIAAEVRQSMDAWITSSLDTLQQNMEQNLGNVTGSLQKSLAASAAALNTAQQDLNARLAALEAALAANNGTPAAAALTPAIAAVRQAVQDSRDQWQKAGNDAVGAVTSVAKKIISLSA
jgi:hypothetical protein